MRSIVFDLDGTLLDSAPDLHAAASRLLGEAGKPALPLATVRSFIGNGIPALVARVVETAGLGAGDEDRLTARFMAIYAEAPARLTRPFPGVPPMLTAFRAEGIRLGICSNKAEALTRQILADLKLDLFDVVIGGDTLPQRKPDPAPLRECFARLGDDGIFVGDSEVDGATAVAAGVPFALFTGGYRKSAVEAIPHCWAFGDFAALRGIVARACASPAA